MIGCGVYKYVYHNEIIYIGMSTTDIERRIKEHKYEIKFRHYKNAFKIYYIQLDNNAQAKGVEKLLIDKYKPILNVKDVYDNGGDLDIESLLPEWIECYDDINYDISNKNPVYNYHKGCPFRTDCDEIKRKEEMITTLRQIISNINKTKSMETTRETTNQIIIDAKIKILDEYIQTFGNIINKKLNCSFDSNIFEKQNFFELENPFLR